MNLKKFLALALALTMVLSGSVMAFADDNGDGEDTTESGGLAVEDDEEKPGEDPGEDPDPDLDPELDIDPAPAEAVESEADIAALAEMMKAHWNEFPEYYTRGLSFEEKIKELDERDEEIPWWRAAGFTHETRGTGFLVRWGYTDAGYNERRIIGIEIDNVGLKGTLDLSAFDALRYLSCTDNQLKTLDVSKCAALSHLDVNFNELTTLDVSGCENLVTLIAFGNRLTSLNVSGCAQLEYLDVYDNYLDGVGPEQLRRAQLPGLPAQRAAG